MGVDGMHDWQRSPIWTARARSPSRLRRHKTPVCAIPPLAVMSARHKLCSLTDCSAQAYDEAGPLEAASREV